MVKNKKMSIQAKASIAYSLASLFSKGVSIITVPIFTRLLTPNEIGIGTTYASWYSILYSVVTLSLCSGSLNIAMMDYKDRRDQYNSACLTLTTLSGLLFALVIYFFRNKICSFTKMDNYMIGLLLISLIINPALDFWYAKQRFEYKYVSSVIMSISVTLLSSIVSILAVLKLSNHSYNLGTIRILSQGSVLIIISLCVYIHIMQKGKCYIDISIWKYAIMLSAPLIVHSLSKSLLDMSDRLMIDSICGKYEAGIYGTVYSLSMLSLIVWNAINTSLIPTTFEYLSDCKYIELNKIINLILVFFGATAVIVTLMAPEILTIFTTKEYVRAVSLVPALSAGIYFTALYNVYGNLILYKKKTVYIMIGTFIAAIINIILNYFFLQVFGYVAAAYTTLISFILLAILQGIIVRILYKKRVLNDNNMFIISRIIAIICLLCNFIYPYNIVRYVILLILLIIGFFNRKKIIRLIKK